MRRPGPANLRSRRPGRQSAPRPVPDFSHRAAVLKNSPPQSAGASPPGPSRLPPSAILAASALLAVGATVAALLLPAPAVGLQDGPPDPDLTPAQARWVDSTLASLDVRERAAQLVFPWIEGRYTARSDTAFRRTVELVEMGIGGVVVSIGPPHAVAARLNHLQRTADVPLLITSDFESGGPGNRIGGMWALPEMLPVGGGTDLPETMAFGAIGEPRFAREAGRITAREARAVGVHMTLAPVADVNTDPRNPIISTRAFGEDPEAVARLVEAFVTGARAGGLLTAAKHYPGHGDTHQDSHLEVPVVDADRARLDSVELVPFRRALEAGAEGILTAHVRLPEVLGPDGPPATLSPYFLTDLLREEWGFDGLVITDALNMGGTALESRPGEASVRALEAGADVLLFPREPRAAVEAVARAVREGRVPEVRLESAVRRVLEAKARAGLHRSRSVSLEAVDRRVGTAAHRAFADTAAVRSLTLPRDRRGLVPLDTARVDRILSVTLARERDLAAGRDFDRTLRQGPAGVAAARVGPDADSADYEELRRRARSADLVLLSAYLPPSAGEGTVEAPERFVEFARGLAREGRPVALVSFGNPYLIRTVPEVGTYLVAWGGRAVSQRAAARALLGRAEVTGRMPVSAPPAHRRDDGLDRRLPGSATAGDPGSGTQGGSDRCAEALDEEALARVDRRIRQAIADSVTPGAALAVGTGGCPARIQGYGRTDWGPDAPAVTDSTIWDLASLTKPLATAASVHHLAEDGLLSLDDPVARHLPGWAGTAKEDATIRQLLLHRGGLPPFRDWWRELEGAAYREALAALEPAAPPGDTTIYSDLGYMALGMVVDEAAGVPLDRYVEREITGPLDLRDTGFRPADSLRRQIAPTEVDTLYRHEHVHGAVHDENAHAMGGVAGHAGLFSSARDLARYARLLLREGWGGAGGLSGDRRRAWLYGPTGLVRIFGAEAMGRFVRPWRAGAERSPGWRTDDDEPAEPFGPGAYGHTGFTGTSLWVDPSRELFVVLLTNRVNPTREETGHRELRRDVHRLVTEASRGVP